MLGGVLLVLGSVFLVWRSESFRLYGKIPHWVVLIGIKGVPVVGGRWGVWGLGKGSRGMHEIIMNRLVG